MPNRGCDADCFGPSRVGLPALHHVTITSNQRDVDRRQNLDQSYSLCLKPKYKTVPNRLFHWFRTHPGVGVFFGFGEQTENQWLAQWPACKEKWLVCCFAGPDKCPRPLNLQEEMLCVHLCFCSVFFLFLLEVCWHLVHVFSLLVFFSCVFVLLFMAVLCPSPHSDLIYLFLGIGYEQLCLFCVLCCVFMV